MRILGLSAFYHDSAAALVEGGRIVAAAQEERFTRKKHDSDYPANAIACCLEQSGIALEEIDRVAFYDKPFLKFERLLETHVALAPRGFRSFRMAVPVWIQEKLFQKGLLRRKLRALAPDVDWEAKLLFAEHHQSHAASAFYPSPFREALVLTMDGVGEWATTSVAMGHDNDLEMTREIHFPHSLGLLYSAFTYYTGFKVNSGEYKVMGLAPYGEPKYAQTILDHLIDLKPDGTFRLNLDCFAYCTGLTMTNAKFDALFGGPPREPDEPLTQRHMDLAASAQAVVEEAGAAADPLAASGNRRSQSLSRRRCRAELRRQRQGVARQSVRRHLDPTRGGRRRGRIGGRAGGESSAVRRTEAHNIARSRRSEHSLSSRPQDGGRKWECALPTAHRLPNGRDARRLARPRLRPRRDSRHA